MVQIKVDPAFLTKNLENNLKSLGLHLSSQSQWLLTKSKNDNWILIDSEKRKLEIDFDQNKRDYQRVHKGTGELIARALGVRDQVKSVIDLTAGLGIDAVLLAQIGFRVVSLERNPLLIFLLKEAQNKTQRKEIKEITWVHADSKIFLESLKISEPTSCYFDPMYPEKKKSALSRQEMVIFRELVGADDDGGETLKLALQKNFVRIAVKRPTRAEALIARPDFQLESKLVRFDIYYPRQGALL
jgi:16S rRNA (guanine1516-N2)-methyltransferase